MANPSPAVVRSIIAKHSPPLLELMDALKAKFNARLVALTIPKAALALGDQGKYGPGAVERDYVSWVPNTDTVAEAREWAAIKAKSREEQARAGARRTSKRRAA